MAVARKKTVRKPTRVTNAGSRQSETVVKPVTPVETGPRFRGLENEDPRFPGYRTVVVPKDDPRDAMHMSPIGAYQGMGYVELSKDTQYTSHAGHVLMGLPIDEHIRRENARLKEHNSRFVDGYAPEMQSALGPNDPLKYDRNKSGLTHNNRVNVHAQLQALQASIEEGN